MVNSPLSQGCQNLPTLRLFRLLPSNLVLRPSLNPPLLAGFPLGGDLKSNESAVVDDGNFWRFEWLLLQKLQR